MTKLPGCIAELATEIKEKHQSMKLSSYWYRCWSQQHSKLLETLKNSELRAHLLQRKSWSTRAVSNSSVNHGMTHAEAWPAPAGKGNWHLARRPSPIDGTTGVKPKCPGLVCSYFYTGADTIIKFTNVLAESIVFSCVKSGVKFSSPVDRVYALTWRAARLNRLVMR